MSGDQLDGLQYEIPQSRGIPPPVRWFFAATVVLILFMGGISALESGYFHVWPVSNATKIDLGNLP